MREIKFRAFDTYSKKFTNYQIWDDMLLFYDKNKGIWLRNIKERYILLQYTGIKDKNGKEIYEEDIVQWIDSGGIIRKNSVFFEDGAFRICNSYFEISEYAELKVIGNIYENKELLK